jgi:hypothetical protein
MGMILSETMPTTAVFWMMMALLGLLVGGLLAAVILGRILGPYGWWARRNQREQAARRAREARPKTNLDAWTESARRLEANEDGTGRGSDEGSM